MSLNPLYAQVMVDISTPKEVFDHVDKEVVALFAAHPSDFTGNHLVVANFAGDPLKYTLCVWYALTLGVLPTHGFDCLQMMC